MKDNEHEPWKLPRYKQGVFEVLDPWSHFDGVLLVAPTIVNRKVFRAFRHSSIDSWSAEEESSADAAINNNPEKVKQSKLLYSEMFNDVLKRLAGYISNQYKNRVPDKEVKKRLYIPDMRVIVYDINTVEESANKLRDIHLQTNLLNLRRAKTKEGNEIIHPYDEIMIVVPDQCLEVYALGHKSADGFIEEYVGGIKPMVQMFADLKSMGALTAQVSIRCVPASYAAAAWVSEKSGVKAAVEFSEKYVAQYRTATIVRSKEGWRSTPCPHCAPELLDDKYNWDLRSRTGRNSVCPLCKAEINREMRVKDASWFARPEYGDGLEPEERIRRYQEIALEKYEELEYARKYGTPIYAKVEDKYDFEVCHACSTRIYVPRRVADKDKEVDLSDDKRPLCAACVATKEQEEGFTEYGENKPQAIFTFKGSAGDDPRRGVVTTQVYNINPTGEVPKDVIDKRSPKKVEYDADGNQYYWTHEPIKKEYKLPDGRVRVVTKYVGSGLRKVYTGKTLFGPIAKNYDAGREKPGAPLPQPANAEETNEQRMAVHGMYQIEQGTPEEQFNALFKESTGIEVEKLGKKWRDIPSSEDLVCDKCYEPFVGEDYVLENADGYFFHPRCNPGLAENLALELKESGEWAQASVKVEEVEPKEELQKEDIVV